MIQLQVNPNEKDHQDLIKLITETALIVPDKTKDIIENERKIVALSQTILKKEWERVKAVK